MMRPVDLIIWTAAMFIGLAVERIEMSGFWIFMAIEIAYIAGAVAGIERKGDGHGN